VTLGKTKKGRRGEAAGVCPIGVAASLALGNATWASALENVVDRVPWTTSRIVSSLR
jgi:hypothetical protein